MEAELTAVMYRVVGCWYYRLKIFGPQYGRLESTRSYASEAKALRAGRRFMVNHGIKERFE